MIVVCRLRILVLTLATLAANGFSASLGVMKRVRRELGLRCMQQKKRFRVTTTDSRYTSPVAPNLAVCGGDQRLVRGRDRRTCFR